MSEQRWRIVDATGAVREVSVEPCHARGMLAPVDGFRGWRASRAGDGPVHAAAEALGDGAHEAVARLAAVRAADATVRRFDELRAAPGSLVESAGAEVSRG